MENRDYSPFWADRNFQDLYLWCMELLVRKREQHKVTFYEITAFHISGCSLTSLNNWILVLMNYLICRKQGLVNTHRTIEILRHLMLTTVEYIKISGSPSFKAFSGVEVKGQSRGAYTVIKLNDGCLFQIILKWSVTTEEGWLHFFVVFWMKLLHSDAFKVCLYSRKMFEKQKDKCGFLQNDKKCALYNFVCLFHSTVLSQLLVLSFFSCLCVCVQWSSIDLCEHTVHVLCFQPRVCLCEYALYPGLYMSVHTVYLPESKCVLAMCVSTTTL